MMFFVTADGTMQSAMTVQGNNCYKLAHMGKKKLRQADQLPETLQCDEKAIVTAKRALDNQ
jgi:hypothetical protein